MNDEAPEDCVSGSEEAVGRRWSNAWLGKATRNLIGLEPAWLREHTDYMVFAGDSFNRYLVDPKRYPHQAAKYLQLFRDFELVKAFADLRHGGEVRIYKGRPNAPFLP